jgi:hypothetical protein
LNCPRMRLKATSRLAKSFMTKPLSH